MISNLADVAEARGKKFGRMLAKDIADCVAMTPLIPSILFTSGCFPWLKDCDPQLSDAITRSFGGNDSVWRNVTFALARHGGDFAEEAFWDAVESELLDGWFIHGSDGDGTVGFVCNGSCGQCSEEE